jgi:hypothetical protein
MNKLIVVLLCLVVLSSCHSRHREVESAVTEEVIAESRRVQDSVYVQDVLMFGGITVTYDSCEYVILYHRYLDQSGISHKGNCKHCKK